MPALLFLAAAAAQVSDGATPYQRAVSIAVFELCPAIAREGITSESAALLATHGFSRDSAAEVSVARGSPNREPADVVVAGSPAPVILAAWPGSHVCRLILAGEEAEEAMAVLEVRLAAAPGIYRRVSGGGFRGTFGGSRMLLSMSRPFPGNRSVSYTITMEPDP
jgi:hypothetical protein